MHDKKKHQLSLGVRVHMFFSDPTISLFAMRAARHTVASSNRSLLSTSYIIPPHVRLKFQGCLEQIRVSNATLSRIARDKILPDCRSLPLSALDTAITQWCRTSTMRRW